MRNRLTSDETPLPRQILDCRTVGPARVIDVEYGPRVDFPEHEHEHEHEAASLCFFLRGTAREAYGRRERCGSPRSPLWYEAEASHRGRFGPLGARILHLELTDPVRFATADRFERTPLEGDRARTAAVPLAFELHHEGHLDPDPLVLESLVHELLAESFGDRGPSAGKTAIERTKELLREEFQRPCGLDHVAHAVATGRARSSTRRHWCTRPT